MKYFAILTLILALLASSPLASAAYYLETTSATTSIHDYDDSMYLNKDFAPKADLFYTPFNAYRTYCAASYCPRDIKVIRVERTQMKLPEPQIIYITHQNQMHHSEIFYNKHIAPIYLH